MFFLGNRPSFAQAALAAYLFSPVFATDPSVISAKTAGKLDTRRSDRERAITVYQRHSCPPDGARIRCVVTAGACCRNPRQFSSARCNTCRFNEFLGLWRGSNDRECNTLVGGGEGNFCYGSRNLRGASWCPQCVPHREGAMSEAEAMSLQSSEAAVAECTKRVDPDLLSKDGERWFRINYEVSAEYTEMLYQWIENDNSTYADLPEVLLAYETEYTEARRESVEST